MGFFSDLFNRNATARADLTLDPPKEVTENLRKADSDVYREHNIIAAKILRGYVLEGLGFQAPTENQSLLKDFYKNFNDKSPSALKTSDGYQGVAQEEDTTLRTQAQKLLADRGINQSKLAKPVPLTLPKDLRLAETGNDFIDRQNKLTLTNLVELKVLEKAGFNIKDTNIRGLPAGDLIDHDDNKSKPIGATSVAKDYDVEDLRGIHISAVLTDGSKLQKKLDEAQKAVRGDNPKGLNPLEVMEKQVKPAVDKIAKAEKAKLESHAKTLIENRDQALGEQPLARPDALAPQNEPASTIQPLESSPNSMIIRNKLASIPASGGSLDLGRFYNKDYQDSDERAATRLQQKTPATPPSSDRTTGFKPGDPQYKNMTGGLINGAEEDPFDENFDPIRQTAVPGPAAVKPVTPPPASGAAAIPPAQTNEPIEPVPEKAPAQDSLLRRVLGKSGPPALEAMDYDPQEYQPQHTNVYASTAQKDAIKITERMNGENPYNLLNVAKTASADDIKQAYENKYKELNESYHQAQIKLANDPEKLNAATKEIKADLDGITKAKSVLTRPKLREAYDTYGEDYSQKYQDKMDRRQQRADNLAGGQKEAAGLNRTNVEAPKNSQLSEAAKTPTKAASPAPPVDSTKPAPAALELSATKPAAPALFQEVSSPPLANSVVEAPKAATPEFIEPVPEAGHPGALAAGGALTGTIAGINRAANADTKTERVIGELEAGGSLFGTLDGKGGGTVGTVIAVGDGVYEVGKEAKAAHDRGESIAPVIADKGSTTTVKILSNIATIGMAGNATDGLIDQARQTREEVTKLVEDTGSDLIHGREVDKLAVVAKLSDIEKEAVVKDAKALEQSTPVQLAENSYKSIKSIKQTNKDYDQINQSFKPDPARQSNFLEAVNAVIDDKHHAAGLAALGVKQDADGKISWSSFNDALAGKNGQAILDQVKSITMLKEKIAQDQMSQNEGNKYSQFTAAQATERDKYNQANLTAQTYKLALSEGDNYRAALLKKHEEAVTQAKAPSQQKGDMPAQLAVSSSAATPPAKPDVPAAAARMPDIAATTDAGPVDRKPDPNLKDKPQLKDYIATIGNDNQVDSSKATAMASKNMADSTMQLQQSSGNRTVASAQPGPAGPVQSPPASAPLVLNAGSDKTPPPAPAAPPPAPSLKPIAAAMSA